MKTKKRSATPSVLEPGGHRERELRAKISDLEAEVRHLKARLLLADPINGMSARNRALIERTIATLTSLEEAGNPLRSSPLEAQRTYKRADSTADEGSPTRWARDLENRIHNKLSPLITEYDLRVSGRYQPPEKEAKVWCRNSTCDDQNKRMARYVGPGKSIKLTQCPTCGGKLSAA